MKGISSIALNGFKYVYLGVFFTLLAGFFYPLITNTDSGNVIAGVLVLFFGLIGSVLVYKAATSGSKREIYLGSGFAVMLLTLYLIFEIAI